MDISSFLINFIPKNIYRSKKQWTKPFNQSGAKQTATTASMYTVRNETKRNDYSLTTPKRCKIFNAKEEEQKNIFIISVKQL